MMCEIVCELAYEYLGVGENEAKPYDRVFSTLSQYSKIKNKFVKKIVFHERNNNTLIVIDKYSL